MRKPVDHGFQSELDFWDRELSLQGDYPDDILNRTVPDRMVGAFPGYLTVWIERLGRELGRTPSALDVGSGPLSMLVHGQRTGLLDLTAVDPLADNYRKLLNKYGLEPTSTLVQAAGEELSSRFERDSFDLVWCHNALDHTQDPKRVFTEMVEVLRPSGLLLLLSWSREATAQGWGGLHQHDLVWEGGEHLVDETRGPQGHRKVVLNEGLPLTLEEAVIEPSRDGRMWMRLVWRKRSPSAT